MPERRLLVERRERRDREAPRRGERGRSSDERVGTRPWAGHNRGMAGSAANPLPHGRATPDDLRVVVADDDVLLRAGLASLLEPARLRGGRRGGRRRRPPRPRAGAHPDARPRAHRHPDAADADGRGPRRGPHHPRGAARRGDPGAVGARRGRARDDAARRWSGHRLPAEDPRRRRRRLPRLRTPRRRGGSVVDPALVQELVSAQRRDDPLDPLSPREREVLG